MNMKNRTVTGEWDGHPISRPKTLGERHNMNSKHKALHSASGKVILKKPRMLTAEESHEKTKHWTGHSKALSHSEQRSYQNRVGRAYNE